MPRWLRSVGSRGGDVTVGELPGDAPIRHALKIGLNCTESCSSSGGGFRWPATKADSGYEGKYGGSDPDVKMGSLLAVAPDADLSWITQPDVRKVAEALRDYGAYVVDETANDGNFLVVQTGAEAEIPNIDSGGDAPVVKPAQRDHTTAPSSRRAVGPSASRGARRATRHSSTAVEPLR